MTTTYEKEVDMIDLDDEKMLLEEEGNVDIVNKAKNGDDGKKKLKTPHISTQCSGILKDEEEIDIRFAKRLAKAIISLNEKMSAKLRPTSQPISKYTSGKKFECTLHLLKYMMSMFNKYMTEKIDINESDDGQITIVHASRRRLFKDPYMKTGMLTSETSDNGKRLDITLEMIERAGRRRKFEEPSEN